MDDMIEMAEAARRVQIHPKTLSNACREGLVGAVEYRKARPGRGRKSLFVSMERVKRWRRSLGTGRGRGGRRQRASRVDRSISQQDRLYAGLVEQPDLVRDTLDELCQSRSMISAVKLASDLVDRGVLSDTGDPVGLVVMIVEDLAKDGLVTYRLRHNWAEIPLDIRVTRSGFARAGYAALNPEVGSMMAKSRGAPLRPDEAMEWRLLSSSTYGGPIERMSLSDHLGLYPDHRAIHPHPSECGPYVTRRRA